MTLAVSGLLSTGDSQLNVLRYEYIFHDVTVQHPRSWNYNVADPYPCPARDVAHVGSPTFMGHLHNHGAGEEG
jgi:hypothetical protein